MGNQNYQYKYQGQELQDELGLGWYSFKYRNYYLAIGRFFNVDPLSEKYAYQSHYNFAENKLGSGRELEGLEIGLAQNMALGASSAAGVSAGSAQSINGGTNVTRLEEQVVELSTAIVIAEKKFQDKKTSFISRLITGAILGINRILNNDSDNANNTENVTNQSTETPKGARTEPRDLEEQLSLEEAKSGAGDKIMEGKLKDPKYHPETGDTDKIGHTHGDGTKTEVHYDRNRKTGEGSGYKIKDDTNNKSRNNLP